MTISIRTKVVKIGNSRGIRIPRTLLDQVGLVDEVELSVEGGSLIVQPARNPRQGWEERFAAMASAGDDRPLDEPAPTQWDAEEWEW